MADKKTLPELHTEQVFKGKIALDVRDSKPDWGPYSPPVAPKDAPNVLFMPKIVFPASRNENIVMPMLAEFPCDSRAEKAAATRQDN